MTEPAPEPNQGRTPPHDIGAEQSVLGGMMLSKDAITQVVEITCAADFYRPAHQIIYDAITHLASRGAPVDAISVNDELTKRGEATRVGGAPYLHTLTEAIPTAANAGYYAKIVADRAALRRLVEVGTSMAQTGYAGDGEADELVRAALADAKARLSVRSTVPPMGQEGEDTSVEGDYPRRLNKTDIMATRYGQLFADITDYALCRLATPDGVLGALLAETSALIHPERVVGATHRPSHMNLASLIIGRTGSGKDHILSAASSVTDPFLEQNPRIRTVTGLASGQGLQDAYSGPVGEEEMDMAAEFISGLARGEELTLRETELRDVVLNMLAQPRNAQLKRVHDAVVLRVGEGRKLFETMVASGSTLASDLIGLLTGGGTDSLRAHDHGRPSPRMEIKAGEVRLCGTILIQPAYLAHLLKEEQGLMGRLLKLPAGLTPEEMDQADELRRDHAYSQRVHDRAKHSLAQYVLNARSGGQIAVMDPVQEQVNAAARTAIVDTGWAGQEPEGQALTLRMAIAGILTAMSSRQMVDLEAWEVAGMMLELSKGQEERVRALHTFEEDRAHAERLSERAATAEVQHQVREPSRRASLLDNALAGILHALEDGQSRTGSQLRDACRVNRNLQRAYQASSGSQLHVDAIGVLEKEGVVQVVRSASGKQIRGVRKL